MNVDKDRKRLIIQVLRRASYIWRPRGECRKKARISRGVYRCAMCFEHFKLKETVVDHITPVVDPMKGWISWDVYIDRMFCSERGFQVLCKPCHGMKTLKENALRSKSSH